MFPSGTLRWAGELQNWQDCKGTKACLLLSYVPASLPCGCQYHTLTFSGPGERSCCVSRLLSCLFGLWFSGGLASPAVHPALGLGLQTLRRERRWGHRWLGWWPWGSWDAETE